MSHPDPTKEYHEDKNMCELCGRHEAVSEYFDDRLLQYCPTYDKFVDPTEKNAEIERQEELDKQEAIAFGKIK